MGITTSSNSSTWVLSTSTCTCTNSVGKGKLEKTIASSIPALIVTSFSMVVTTNLLQKLTVTDVGSTSKNL